MQSRNHPVRSAWCDNRVVELLLSDKIEVSFHQSLWYIRLLHDCDGSVDQKDAEIVIHRL